MTKRRIYLAGRYSRREELLGYASLLIADGHTVTSRWLQGDHQISDTGLNDQETHALRQKFALEDWADLCNADTTIFFSEEPRSSNSRGGRHVEFGAALRGNQHVAIVGPRENVFCCLPTVAVFPDFAAARAWANALVASPTTSEPFQAAPIPNGARDACRFCGGDIVYRDGWAHDRADGLAPKHPAYPKGLRPLLEVALPDRAALPICHYNVLYPDPQQRPPAVGAVARCTACGCTLEFTGLFWQHVSYDPNAVGTLQTRTFSLNDGYPEPGAFSVVADAQTTAPLPDDAAGSAPYQQARDVTRALADDYRQRVDQQIRDRANDPLLTDDDPTERPDDGA